jgi:hypothetical protein
MRERDAADVSGWLLHRSILEVTMPADPEPSQSDATAETEGTPQGAEPVETPEDDVKRKFREALARKRGAHNEAAGANGSGRSKIHGAHGPAAHQRSFRRKSG